MAQNKAVHRQRVKISTNDDGTPVYKWVQGRTMDELNDAIIEVYISSGRIWEFMNREAETAPAQQMTFQEYAQHWFALYKAHLKETSRSSYQYVLDHYLFPRFGKMLLQDISTDSIQLLLNHWKSLAKSTIVKMELTLSQIFRSAVKDKLIKENPVDKERLKNPSTVVNEREAISEEHFLDILANLDMLEEGDRRLIALLALTGMRRGEALGLQWEDMDWDEGLIHVKRNVVYTANSPIITTPKSKKGLFHSH